MWLLGRSNAAADDSNDRSAGAIGTAVLGPDLANPYSYRIWMQLTAKLRVGRNARAILNLLWLSSCLGQDDAEATSNEPRLHRALIRSTAIQRGSWQNQVNTIWAGA